MWSRGACSGPSWRTRYTLPPFTNVLGEFEEQCTSVFQLKICCPRAFFFRSSSTKIVLQDQFFRSLSIKNVLRERFSALGLLKMNVLNIITRKINKLYCKNVLRSATFLFVLQEHVPRSSVYPRRTPKTGSAFFKQLICTPRTCTPLFN